MLTEKIQTVTVRQEIEAYCRPMNYAVLVCNKSNPKDEYIIATFYSEDDAEVFMHGAPNHSPYDHYEVRKIIK